MELQSKELNEKLRTNVPVQQIRFLKCQNLLFKQG